MPVVAGLIRSRFQQDFVQTILLNIIYFPWALFVCLPCFRVYIRFKLFLISTLGDDKIKHVKVRPHDYIVFYVQLKLYTSVLIVFISYHFF